MSSIMTITKKYRISAERETEIFEQEELQRSKGEIVTKLGKTDNSSLLYLVNSMIDSFNKHKVVMQNSDLLANCYRAFIIDLLMRTPSQEALTLVKAFSEGLIDE